MKKVLYLKIVVIFFGLVMLSCSSSGGDDSGNTAKEKFNLTVNNGSGSGTYEEGQRITIVANTPEELQLFTTWSGDVQTIAGLSSQETTLTMPAKNITISANYEQIAVSDAIAIT